MDEPDDIQRDVPALPADEAGAEDAYAYLAEPCESCLERMALLERRIGYAFRSKRLLFKALTHSSYMNENPRSGMRHNERLEFLGDAVLGVILAEHLFRFFPERREGELSLMRSWLVSESNLSELAQEMDIGYYLLLGCGEDASGGRGRAALLADAFEALVGAIYLDGGFVAAGTFVLAAFAVKLRTVDEDKAQINYKNALQQEAYDRFGDQPQYVVVAVSGPEHTKQFSVEVRLAGRVLAAGDGASKKEAEMNAARTALVHLAQEHKRDLI